jgi:phage tail sheath gpL-like
MTTAISPNRVARQFGQQFIFQNLSKSTPGLPQRIILMGRASTASAAALTKTQVFSAKEVGDAYGYGAPLHQMAEQVLPQSGDGVGDIPVSVLPLPDGSAAGTGSITPVGSPTESATFQVKFNNKLSASFTLAAAATVADAVAALVTTISGMLAAPVTAVDNASTSCDLTSKWQGASANSVTFEVVGDTDKGMTFGAAASLTTGAGVPADTEIQTALAQIGDDWETWIVQEIGDDTVMLNELAAWNEGRWGATVNKFLACAIFGTTETNVTTATTVPDGRKSDRTNCQIPAPGSANLPWEIAARTVSRAAVRANGASPARSYDLMPLSGIDVGSPEDQWSSAERDTAVKAGCSTVELLNGEYVISDLVTFYHPDGEDTPPYRYVVTIVKLQQLANDMRNVFTSERWAGCALVPEDQFIDDPTAKKPSMAKAEVSRLMSGWGAKAIIADPATAKGTIVVAIDGGNPNRLNISHTVQITGNTKVISADQNFGFFFGV